MNTEARFLLAILLMLVVLVGTNILFPPVMPEELLAPDSVAGAAAGEVATGEAATGDDRGAEAAGDAPTIPVIAPTPTVGAETPEPEDAPPEPGETAAPEQRVIVRGPLYRFEFSTYGARMHSAELSQFAALNREGPVELVPDGADGYLGQKLVVGSDTVDLSRVPFKVEPEAGLTLEAGGGAATLRFIYEHPTSPFNFETEYQFDPDEYTVHVRGVVVGLDRPLLLTDLGEGLAFVEADSTGEAREMAYVVNHVQDGIDETLQGRAEPTIVEGPLLWGALRSKYFVLAMLAGPSNDSTTDINYLGGLLVQESELPDRVRVAAAQVVGRQGEFAYRLFMGPQDFGLLSALGWDMQEVNPVGWSVFRPILRPFVAIITTILIFLHTKLSLGYGWVLIVFGVAMRIVLFPLNHKAMKAQLRNMAVQPLLQEIQAKHKDNPEKLQKEMMKLYKDHGFNPLAGCLPMLLPFPMLIALFFVFRSTIELRGVPFLWLPDLSAPDPLYLLPVFLGISMFLMQYVSLKSLDAPNPQMKMMMWMMPPMMVFIFLNLASGLNLYYAIANIATIPQQMWIASERKKMKGKPPPKIKSE